jgi:hypothetical protein
VDLVADFGREQLALAMDASGALLRNVQAIRTIQQQAAHEASMRHRSAARDLRARCDAVDLFAVPVALLQGELAAATRYWQDLAAAALEAQTEIVGSACAHLFDAQTVLESAAAVDSLEKTPGGARIGATVPAPRRARRAG